ncbi:unnamed protein product [Amaranthus hypochondriacus]
MMSFASTLLKILFDIVGKVGFREIKKILDADKNLINLESTAKEGRDLFNNVKIFYLYGNGIAQADLLTKLEELTKMCYDVEDHINDFALDIANHHLKSHEKPVRDVLWRCPKNVCKPIKKLQEKLKNKIAEVKLLSDNSTQFKPPVSLSSSDQKLSAYFVGRKVEIEDIVLKLISNDVEFNGVSIIGMDGLGKTQLALAILEDIRISELYCIRLPVRVLDDSFDLKEPTRLLEEQFSKNGFINEQIHSALIVIDNLLGISVSDWDTLWDDIKSLKIKMNINIKIIITTHNPEVSTTTKTFPYYLKPLSDENCKTLILDKALSHNKNLSREYLSNIADTLAIKCEGLPIVATIFGVILAQRSPCESKVMLTENLWHLHDIKKEILPILISRYLNMDPQLEQCVAYFSLFSDGYHFNIHKLINLWAGEGFLQNIQDTTTFHEIGNRYFSCLRGRSILQDCNNVNNNELYELHKFTHKFSSLAASKTFVRFEKDMKTLSVCSKYARHLSFLCDTIEEFTWAKLKKMKRLRTFLALHCKKIGRIPDSFFTKLTRLRVLDLNDTNITELSDSICSLKFLRFLDVSSTRLKKLPSKLFELSLLEFLHLHNTQELISLPPCFCNLTNLVSLDWKMSDIRRFTQPSHIGNLSKLQTLPLFIVKDEDGYRIGELKDMNDLRESLCITNLEKVKNKAEAEEAMLDKKQYLKRIDLQWMRSSSEGVAKEVLEGLKPHCYLNELNIINYGGDMFPEWIFHPSQMFEKIHLEGCLKCNALPAFGGLQNLKTLFIEHFSELQLIDHEFCGPPSPSGVGHFPELEYLFFKDLPQLREWKELEAIDFPRLRILKVEDCSQLISLPSLENLTSLVELQIESCPTMRSLPELPDSVESLKIRNSNLLKGRCVRGGADWMKVDCVPKVEIDNEIIQTSGRTSTHRLAPPGQHQNNSIMYKGYRYVKNSSGGVLNRVILWS